MALTELQLPTKQDFYSGIKNLANEIARFKARWEAASDFLADVGVADMDAMGVPTGAIRTDLTEFRTVLDELVAYLNNQAVTPTNDPKAVIDKLRNMLVI